MAGKNSSKQNRNNLTVQIIRDSKLWSYMPDPDSIITGSLKGLHIYDEMKSDARVGSLFDDRRNATHNLPATVSSVEDARVQEYMDRYLNTGELRKLGFILLDGALTYGFQPAEIIWKEKDGYLVIDGIDGHDICRYRFNADGDLFYDHIPLDQENKWIIHRNEGDRYNRPYGRAYLKRVYWPWRFKQLGWQYWLTATEKFSVPSIVALFDQSDPDKAKNTAEELADLITQIGSGSGGAFANIKGIQQLSMGGSVADFNSLITACDLQIAYGMTGQSLATNVSETGTQALGTVQERTKQAAYENDARSLQYTLNRLIEMAVTVNFGPVDEYPVFSFDTQDYASFQEVMQAHSAGIEISRAAMYSRYGLPEPEGEDDILEPSQNAGGYGMMGSAFNFSDPGKKKSPASYDFADKVTAEEIEKVSQVIAIETEGYRKIRKRIDEGIKAFNERIKADPSILTKQNVFGEWKPEVDEELIQAVYEMFFKSWLLGMSHNARIKPSSDFADVNVSFDFGMTYEEAMEYAGGRIALTPVQFRKLSDDMKMHAFTVGRLSQLDMIEKVQRLYLKELGSSDMSVEDFLSSVFEIDGERAGFAGYYTTVFRTNMQKDYNAGKAQQMMEDPPMYLEFIGIDDDRQSEICRVRNGVIRPYTDPWWDDNWPPLHYNCRSTVREIFREEADEMKIKPTPLPNIEASDRTIENADGKKTVIKRNTPVSGFGRNPAKDNAFWATSISQQNRIASYLIQEELNGVAGRTIASDFSAAKKGYTDVSVSSGGVRYQNGLEKETEFKNNLETARVLAESEGYYVELRKAKDLKNNPQWDAWLNGMDKIEFKNPTTRTARGMAERVTDGYKQAQLVAVTVTSNDQIAAISGMLSGPDMKRTFSTRSVKGLYVIKDGNIVFLSNADMKNPDVYNPRLDALKTQ